MGPKVNPPVIQANDCTGCKNCVTICPSFVFEMRGDTSKVIRGDWCIGCGHCVAVCPTGAILHESNSLDLHPKRGEAPAIFPEVLELLLRERRSIRIYTNVPVPEDLLNKILDAGRYAPTGSNSQNVHYVVMKSLDQIKELQKMTLDFYEKIFNRVQGTIGRFFLSLITGRNTVKYLKESLPIMEYAREQIRKGQDRIFYHAPVIILTHAESWDTSSPFNCSVALYNCSLMAHTLGLGCCFNGILVNAVNHSTRIKRWLNIPKDHRCYSAMTLGFPNVKYLRLINRNPPQVTWR